MGPEENNGFRYWNRKAWNITKNYILAFEYNFKRIRFGIDIDLETPFKVFRVYFLFFELETWDNAPYNDRQVD